MLEDKYIFCFAGFVQTDTITPHKEGSLCHKLKTGSRATNGSQVSLLANSLSLLFGPSLSCSFILLLSLQLLQSFS